MVGRVHALRIGRGREVADALVVGRLSCATGKSEQRAGKGERDDCGDVQDGSAWAREARSEMGVRLRGPTRSRSHLKIPHRPFASFAFGSPCIEYTFAHAREPVRQGYAIRQMTRYNANISENMRAHFGVLGQVAEARAVVARGRTGINAAVRPYALVRFSVFSLSRSAKTSFDQQTSWAIGRHRSCR